MRKSKKVVKNFFRIRSQVGVGALLALVSLGMAIIGFALLVITALSSSGSGVAHAQIQPTRDPNLPTPTPPAGWQQRPNLHILLTDQDGQPVGGVQLTVYSYEYNAATGQYDTKKVLQGVSAIGTDIHAGAGWANLDAASIIHGIYHVEMREPDDSLILPYDPNGPHYGTGGQPAPIDYTMSLLDLSEGDVAYVYHFEIRPLLAGSISQATPYPVPTGAPTPKPTPTLPPAALAAKRAVYFKATEKWIYFPGGAAPLAQVATVTPAPGTATAHSNTNGASKSNAAGTANPATVTARAGTSIISSSNPSPTPAQNSGNNPNLNSNTDVTPGPFDTPKPVATVGNVVHQELGGLPPGAHLVTSGANPNIAVIVYDKDYTPPPATATALPTPTSQYESQNCGAGCFSTVQAPTHTTQAATVWAAMTAGVWTPDGRDAGRNGGVGLPAPTGIGNNGKNSSATPGAGAGSGTVVAAVGSNNSTASPAGTNTAGTNTNKISGGNGSGGFPWLPVLGVVGGILLLVLAGWLNRRRTARQEQTQGQGQGQTATPIQQRPGPPTKPQS